MAFSRALAQSAEADGARARNRMGFFEHEYEQEQEHARENIDWGSQRLEHRNFNSIARSLFRLGSATKQTQTTRHEHRRNATLMRFSIERLPEHEIQPKHHDAPHVSDEGWLI